MPLSENQLIVPCLIAMASTPNGEIQTSKLIRHIASQFILDDQDLDDLVNRNDQKYTQIVRNLKSHKTLKTKGYAEEIEGGFRILPAGLVFLEDNGFI